MPLFRCTYVREGKPAGMTFAHDCAASAAQFAYETLQPYILAAGGGWVLTVSAVKSKQEERMDSRAPSRR